MATVHQPNSTLAGSIFSWLTWPFYSPQTKPPAPQSSIRLLPPKVVAHDFSNGALSLFENIAAQLYPDEDSLESAAAVLKGMVIQEISENPELYRNVIEPNYGRSLEDYLENLEDSRGDIAELRAISKIENVALIILNLNGEEEEIGTGFEKKILLGKRAPSEYFSLLLKKVDPILTYPPEKLLSTIKEDLERPSKIAHLTKKAQNLESTIKGLSDSQAKVREKGLPYRGSMAWVNYDIIEEYIEKRVEKLKKIKEELDQLQNSSGQKVVIRSDFSLVTGETGNCLFDNVAAQFFPKTELSNLHILSREVRRNAVETMSKNESRYLPFYTPGKASVGDGSVRRIHNNFLDYLRIMKGNLVWGDHLEIQAIADHYKVNIDITQDEGPTTHISPNDCPEEESRTTIYLHRIGGCHYISAYPTLLNPTE